MRFLALVEPSSSTSLPSRTVPRPRSKREETPLIYHSAPVMARPVFLSAPIRTSGWAIFVAVELYALSACAARKLFSDFAKETVRKAPGSLYEALSGLGSPLLLTEREGRYNARCAKQNPKAPHGRSPRPQPISLCDVYVPDTLEGGLRRAGDTPSVAIRGEASTAAGNTYLPKRPVSLRPISIRP